MSILGVVDFATTVTVTPKVYQTLNTTVDFVILAGVVLSVYLMWRIRSYAAYRSRTAEDEESKSGYAKVRVASDLCGVFGVLATVLLSTHFVLSLMS